MRFDFGRLSYKQRWQESSYIKLEHLNKEQLDIHVEVDHQPTPVEGKPVYLSNYVLEHSTNLRKAACRKHC